MNLKTARRFLNRNNWKILKGDGSPSFWTRVERARTILGADPLRFVKQDREAYFSNFVRLMGF